uniref:Uncharacterized protein n=1 Tax=viral metagenome TaxID=1070528 RepID=A0A6M3L0W3_9ZZZZ
MPAIILKKEHFVIVPLNVANEWCALPYHNHPKGCPNYLMCKHARSKKWLANEFFDLDRPMWIVWSSFDLEKHAKRMKKLHPNWSERQCRNLLYWQRGVDNKTFHLERRIKEKFNLKGYIAIGEGFGINVYATCRNAGLKLEHIRRPIKIVRKLSLLMKPKMIKERGFLPEHLR